MKQGEKPQLTIVEPETEALTPKPLTNIERIALSGLEARGREIQTKYREPFEADCTIVWTGIATRLGTTLAELFKSYRQIGDTLVPITPPEPLE